MQGIGCRNDGEVTARNHNHPWAEETADGGQGQYLSPKWEPWWAISHRNWNRDRDSAPTEKPAVVGWGEVAWLILPPTFQSPASTFRRSNPIGSQLMRELGKCRWQFLRQREKQVEGRNGSEKVSEPDGTLKKGDVACCLHCFHFSSPVSS